MAGMTVSGCSKNSETIRELDSYVNSLVNDNKAIHNAVLLVETPEFRWKGAAGMANPGEKIRMLPDDQFFIASTAKMMTSTIVMKLVEEGKVDLDGKIKKYLPHSIISGLHMLNGKSYGEFITVRQVLNHTTGIPDIWSHDEFMQSVFSHPDKLWQPEELVFYVINNMTPHFIPGEKMKYSDSNYNLAGLIIESVTGKTLREVSRELLFDPLGMNHTYRQFREPGRESIKGRKPSHSFFGETDYTSVRSLSADWGGGGLQSTTEDLNTFIRAFARDEIFNNTGTKKQMMEWVNWRSKETYYGLGIMRVVFSGSGQNDHFEEMWGHSGASGAFMFYWPLKDASICGTINQVEEEHKIVTILVDVMKIINKEYTYKKSKNP
jgi:D-alanyl-D-alanine carboxypeptidase